MVESLIVLLPTLYLFLATLQLIELFAGNLIVRHAAWMAARSASVVLADDKAKYDTDINTFAGKRRADVTTAARMILAAKPQFDLDSTSVAIEGASGTGPLTATVRSQFRCFARFVNVVCGGSDSIELVGRARHAYFQKAYVYE